MNGYFDCAATGIINKKNIDKVLETYPINELFGNPSSIHMNGIQSKQILEHSREIMANYLKCNKEDIIFTSGGTESNNMAIKGIMLQYKPEDAEMITSKIEHPSVLNTCKELENMGYKIHYIETNKYGVLNTYELISKINKKTKLISIMYVNNEIGTIQPIEYISQIANKNNIIFHSDMVQAVGLCDIDLNNIDMASFSAHKFGGLKGTGILYKKSNIKLKPLINGGGQEQNLRSGTENVFGNIIMALCLEDTIKSWNKSIKQDIFLKRNRLFLGLKEYFGSKLILNGGLLDRVANNLNISFKNIDSRTLQLMLSQNDIQISIGSACHSNNEELSYVLKAIKTPKEFINGAIRITIPVNITDEDIENLKNNIIKNVNYLYNKEEI